MKSQPRAKASGWTASCGQAIHGWQRTMANGMAGVISRPKTKLAALAQLPANAQATSRLRPNANDLKALPNPGA
jgi:hypothetical protein